MKILIGADPELFVQSDNVLVSAHGMIPGTKEAPHAIPHGAIQVDGNAVEFNIDPASSREEFVHNIQSVMEELRQRIPYGQLCSLTSGDIANWEEVPPEAKIMGCEPELDADTLDFVTPPDLGPDSAFRTAGGHVHIGWTEGADPYDMDHVGQSVEVVKNLDRTLGLASLLWDKDNDRRRLYGKAGACRIKPYGVEYRTLSSAWLRSEKLMKFIYDTATSVTRETLAGTFDSSGLPYPIVQEIINNGDQAGARHFLPKEITEYVQHA